jgi:hypothetical protein
MWEKKGLIFNVKDFENESIKSHASIPFALNIKDDEFLIFYSSRNLKGQSIPYTVNATIKNGEINIHYNTIKKIMDLGCLGTFDDCGIMPSCVVKHNEDLYMYYIGWNPQVSVSYRLSIGLAVSRDNGKSFERISEGPILDRDIEEPFFNTAPFVLKLGDTWKMWYISCTEWSIINNHTEPKYLIKSANSKDGIIWKRDSSICVDYDEKAEAIGRPCVLIQEDYFEMYFSYRKINNYRNEKGSGYQIGKANSKDLLSWDKIYENKGLELSKTGWDSEMMEYCHVFHHEGIDYMLYNGNNFGLNGFGYAIRKK